MASTRTQDTRAPSAFSPRSPWFWLISGIGTLALGLVGLAILTRPGILPGSEFPPPLPPPAARTTAIIEAPPPQNLMVPPTERIRELRMRLDRVTAQQKEIELERQKIEAAIAAARAGGGTPAEVDWLRARLIVVDRLWWTLEAEREKLVVELDIP